MSEREFRHAVRVLLEQPVDGLSPAQKSAAVRKELADYLTLHPAPEPNDRTPWTDDQLRLVLSHPPTAENAVLLARALGRGVGGVVRIFRWAGQSERHIQETQSEHAFVQQVLRIRKEMRWRSVGGGQKAEPDRHQQREDE